MILRCKVQLALTLLALVLEDNFANLIIHFWIKRFYALMNKRKTWPLKKDKLEIRRKTERKKERKETNERTTVRKMKKDRIKKK